jgi:hypothetical protein
MSLQQSKILLEKINSFYQSISLDGEISTIERDLMLSYVRQFYEAILTESSNNFEAPSRASEPPAKRPEPNVEKINIPTPSVEVPVVVEQPKITPAPTAIEMEVVAPKPTIVETPIIEKIEPIASPIVKEIERPIPTPKIPEPTPTVPVHKIIEKPKPINPKPLIKPSVERVASNQLFEEKMSRELSDKLGELPIDDIRKGMGINERIIFLNELFDGNQSEFENAIVVLNNANNFDDAKHQLMIFATRFDWSSKEKHAKSFIRLVRRKHS